MAIYYIRADQTIVLESEDEAVVVSPTLYWYAHADFPTRSLARAKRLADAFMDTRPERYREIFVRRTGKGYDCYAYDPEELAEKLASAENPDAPVYFLQQLHEELPLRIDGQRVAENLNGVAVEIPDEGKAAPSLADVDFGKTPRPFRAPGTKTGGKALPLLFLLLLGITTAADLGLRFQKYFALDAATQKLQADRSFYEIRAIVKRYEKIEAEQKKLRAQIQKRLKQGGLRALECTPAGGCRGE